MALSGAVPPRSVSRQGANGGGRTPLSRQRKSEEEVRPVSDSAYEGFYDVAGIVRYQDRVFSSPWICYGCPRKRAVEMGGAPGIV